MIARQISCLIALLLLGCSALADPRTIAVDAGGNVTGVFINPQPGVAKTIDNVDESDPRIVAYLAKQAVPRAVSAMQAKVALKRAGLLDNVQAWVNGQGAETQLIWNSATVFNRSSGLIATAAAALALSPAQVDQLFVTAAAINP